MSVRVPGTIVAVAALALAVGLTPHASTAAAGGGGPATVAISPAQIAAGNAAFAQHCATCHGAALEGGAGPALSGPNFKTLSTKVKATVSDVFGYMTSSMPMNAPASLSHSQYVAIMAFVLSKNGYAAGTHPLTFDAANASKAPVVKR